MIFRNNIQEIRRGDKRIDSGEYNESVRKLNALGNFTFNAEDYQSIRWTGSQWILIARSKVDQVFLARSNPSAQIITGTDNIDWTNTSLGVKTSDFTHDTSTNPDQITFEATGRYLIRANVVLSVPVGALTGTPPHFNIVEIVKLNFATDGDSELSSNLQSPFDFSAYVEIDTGYEIIQHGMIEAYIDPSINLGLNKTLRVRLTFTKVNDNVTIRKGTSLWIEKLNGRETT